MAMIDQTTIEMRVFRAAAKRSGGNMQSEITLGYALYYIVCALWEPEGVISGLLELAELADILQSS